MKIVFFGADYPPTGGGIATYSYELIETVKAQSKVEEVDMLMFDHSKIGFFYVGLSVFKKFWKNRDYDVFHSLNLFPVGFWVIFWGKVFRKKTIVTFYGTDANDTSASKKTFLIKKWTLRNANSLITISEYTKKATENKYKLSKDKIRVIYPTVPKVLLQSKQESSIDIKKKYNIKEDDFIILSVCRLVKRKGVEFLVRAVSEMKDPSAKLFMIGEGKEKENLIKLVNDLRLQDQVFILGKVVDIIPFYKIANVATLVSFTMDGEGDFEGLGLVLLEAQSYGVPVIGSRSGGIPDAFQEDVTGISVEPRNVTDLTSALSRLKNNKQLAQTLSKNTSDFLEKRFGLKNTIEKYIELCSGL